MLRKIARRAFVTSTSAVAAGSWVAGSRATAESRSPNDRLNIACVGVGTGSVGGIANLPAFADKANIVALCDVDDKYAGPTFERYPKAARYHDFRRMLDKQKDIDAVVVSTPDHMHAAVAVAAMRMGKHVYVEKPLARTIYEARLMRETAAKYKVATQMGNQGTGSPSFRQAVEIIRSGGIGVVRDVHGWTDRPTWPQGGFRRPAERWQPPSHLKWDLFLGVAKERPYHPKYHPFVWRGWWVFGTCVLGDMACHITNLAFLGLHLEDPVSVEAESSGANEETGPKWAIIKYQFPARGKLPPVSLTWYEGGKKPPKEVAYGQALPPNGSLVVGDQGAILTHDMYCTRWSLLPEDKLKDYQLPESPPSAGHHQEWILACKGQGPTMSNFDYAGRMTESLLVGNLAIRTGKRIEWNAAEMKANRLPEADQYIRPEFRKGWSV